MGRHVDGACADPRRWAGAHHEGQALLGEPLCLHLLPDQVRQGQAGGTGTGGTASHGLPRIVPAGVGDAVLMHGQLYHAGAGVSPAGPRVVLTLACGSVDELAEGAPARCRIVRGSRIHRGRGATRA
jgi:hypothetical protein